MRNQSVQIMDGKFVINTAVRIPVYKQVISQIEQKIISGEYAPGAQLPSMNELAAYLDVSRETIKKAYLKLRDKGLLAPRQGKGFYVRGLEEERQLKVVYFPSCLNQTMGTDKASKGMKPLAEEMAQLLQKAGYQVIYPKNMDALWEASEHGKYPVVCDQSPCLHRMKQHIAKVELYEAAEFVWKFLKDRLEFTQTDTPIALHLTCSTKLMKIDRIVHDLACLCSSNVLVPQGVGCCGFAGDKGMTHPELNRYALRKLRSQIEEMGIEVGYSNSRTCEIGLQTNSGILDFHSIAIGQIE